MSGLLALIALVGGFGFWATQTTLAGAVVVTGQVKADQNQQAVQPVIGGVVAQVFVQNGDVVQRGEVLLRLDITTQENALAFAEDELFAVLAQLDRLHAQFGGTQKIDFRPDLVAAAQDDPSLALILQGQNELFAASLTTLRQHVQQATQSKRQIDARLSGIDAQLVSLVYQRDLVREGLNKQEALLERKLIPAATVLEARRLASQIDTDLAKMTSQREEAVERLAEIDAALNERLAERREAAIAKARDLEEPMRKFRADIAKLKNEIARAEIRAPVSGVIHRMQPTGTSTVLRAGDTILYIVPPVQRPVIAAQVLPHDIDQISFGQPVNLRLAALNQRITPEIRGHISAVSPDAIVDERRGSRYFAVEVTVAEDQLARLPSGTALLAGMPVEVFVQTGARTPLHYLTKPMTDYFAHAMRGN
ncbi:Type I secretion membrane fusion protein, HlyD family [Sulfitobacter noctilucicola]|nr:Type I secretion membrane fusion protein, HlyD family [Sulfitobacter noctilucicola]